MSSEAVDRRAERGGHHLAVAIFAGAALVAVFGGVSLRGLYADGAAYLAALLSGERLALWEPARTAAQVLQQLPALAAARSGALGLTGIEVLWSLWLELMPVLLVAACAWILPRGRRGLILFPLLHLLGGTMVGSAYPMAEGTVAAAWFWLMLTAVQFRGRGAAGRAGVALLAAGALAMHELFAFLAPVLVAAAVLRGRAAASRGERRFCLGLAVWFGFVALYQARWIVVPNRPLDRGVLAHQILRLWFVTDGYMVNLAAVIGLAGVLVAGGLLWVAWFGRPAVSPRARRAVVAAFAALAVGGVVATALTARMVPPWLQFAGRTVAGLVSLPLAAAAIWAWRHPGLSLWLTPYLRAAVAVLAIGQFGWHAVEIARWRAGVEGFRTVLAAGQGEISWEDALASLPPRQARAMRFAGWGWTNPAMSVLLAPGGRVRGVLAWPAGRTSDAGERPGPREVPTSRFWDLTEYFAALPPGA